MKIPSSGYLVAFHGGDYIASFRLSPSAYRNACDLARKIAEHSKRMIDVIRVDNRGEDRTVVREISPYGAR